MAETEKVQQPVMLATPQYMAQLDAQRRQAEMEALGGRRPDETVRGGEYIGEDGRKHNAHGHILDGDDSDLAGTTSVLGVRALNEITSEAELDALEASIKAKREALQAEEEAREEAEKAAAERAKGGEGSEAGSARKSAAKKAARKTGR
jgi:hypothetical protein